MTDDVNTSWGLCVDCRWWQIEPHSVATHQTAGVCTDPSLTLFQLRVTGNSGCNRFRPGAVQRVSGSSLKPPPALTPHHPVNPIPEQSR